MAHNFPFCLIWGQRSVQPIKGHKTSLSFEQWPCFASVSCYISPTTHTHKHPFPFHQHTRAVQLLLLPRVLFTPWKLSSVLSNSTLTPSVFLRVKLKSTELVFSSFWWNFAALKAGPCSFRWRWRILRSRWSSGVAWWAGNNPHCSGRTLGAPPAWSERAVGLLIHGQGKKHTHTHTGGLLVTAPIITVKHAWIIIQRVWGQQVPAINIRPWTCMYMQEPCQVLM